MTFTTNAAEANGVGDVVGQLAPGVQADIVLRDTRGFGCGEGDPAGHIVANSGQEGDSSIGRAVGSGVS